MDGMPVLLPGLAADIARQKRFARITWKRHAHVAKFLADCYPGPWQRIQTCRLGNYRTYRSIDRPDIYKATPYACHQIPYCLICTRAERNRRLNAALNNFSRCTPKGQQPRFYHAVQTAPIYEDGTGWGNEASRNVKAFGKLVFEGVAQFLGPGTGALLSYHDFGERAFAKRHPHMDFTINGWMLHDDQPAWTPRIDLTGGGRGRWDAAIAARATRLRIDAGPGNFFVQGPWTGFAAYRAILAYQLRELVDLRKITYSRSKGVVEWLDYKRNRRQRFTVNDFKAGLAEYQYRLKQWPTDGDEALELHRAYGHLAKRLIRRTQTAMGGQAIPHGKSCPCTVCGDWERVDVDDIDIDDEAVA